MRCSDRSSALSGVMGAVIGFLTTVLVLASTCVGGSSLAAIPGLVRSAIALRFGVHLIQAGWSLGFRR